MAERPIFVPKPGSRELVQDVFLQLKWHPGFATVQKEKNIKALHDSAALAGYRNILEVSTKSANKRGRHLSAFHMKVKTGRSGEIALECAFQASKVFERGGPFIDLYKADALQAKIDPRLKESGSLIAFEFEGVRWPLEPKTVFYDWLYARSLYPHQEWARKLHAYDGFSDIEFNPFRSINCQARSVALFLSLLKRGALDDAVRSSSSFIRTLTDSDYRPQLRTADFAPQDLFEAKP